MTDLFAKEMQQVDADGDGFGNIENARTTCVPSENEVLNTTDCNDGDASVNPAATEICDGIDNDCSGATSEDGMVHVTDSQGTVTDLTTIMSAGTEIAPVSYTATEALELSFCTGEYAVLIDTTEDLTLRGFGDVSFVVDPEGDGMVWLHELDSARGA